MKITHTPGARTVHENDSEGIHVLGEPFGTIIAEHFNTVEDALLDAAAPSMLEALESVVDAWHANDANFERELRDGTPDWLGKARAALKSAKGGE